MTTRFSPKVFFLFVLLILSCGLLRAQYQLTFQVDMSNEVVSTAGVHIAGDFQEAAGLGANWNPSATQIFDPDGDGIFSITASLPAGTYQYKFINGNAWGNDENPPSDCSVGNTNNRTVTLGSADLTLSPVPFNACAPMMRVSVNLEGLDIDPAGIYIMGDFQEAAGYGQNWDPAATPMVDINQDGTYEFNVTLPAGEYQYVFVNGNSPSGAETVPSECGLTGSQGALVRSYTVGPGNPAPPTVCFSECTVCDPNLSDDFATRWWHDAVFYEMFVRSFKDSDGDGIGDFQGAIEKLDYLNDGDPSTSDDLGVTALWLMPMMASPSYHGYDVTDYYAVEPDYGTMADFEAFLDACHQRGIRVIIDLVLNHSSSQHPWFTQSANNANGYRDWYVWSDTNPGFPGPWGQNVWHNNGGDYYYGVFWGGMPDLNYNHQPVRDEMFSVTDFWLEKGVDGFRLDAIKYLVEEGESLEDTQETFNLIEEWNAVYKADDADHFSVGEVWSNTNSIIPYVQENRLDVCFEFDLANDILSAVNTGDPNSIRQQMAHMLSVYPRLQYATFLTNHDMDRMADRVNNDVARMKQAASLYLTLPGVPFLYYGEEINMRGTGAHENIRRPMQWTDGPGAGFTTGAPWNEVGGNYTSQNVEELGQDQNSLLSHYRKMIHLRNASEPLRRGNYLPVSSTENQLLSFIRVRGAEAVLVLANTGNQSTSAVLSLPESGLAPGAYFLSDLYNDEEMGTIEIDENGGFADFDLAQTISGHGTLILSITLENPVSVAETNSPPDFEISLSPNPASDHLQLSLPTTAEGAAIQIYNISGQLMAAQNSSQSQLSIPVSDWPRGVYVVQVTIGGSSAVKRLVLE